MLFLAACSEATEQKLFVSDSPNGQCSAELFFVEEGQFGSTRYRLDIDTAADGKQETVFRGDNAWAEASVWVCASTLILPFCFGDIISVISIVAADTGNTLKLRSGSSSNIRLHFITTPDTRSAGKPIVRRPSSRPACERSSFDAGRWGLSGQD